MFGGSNAAGGSLFGGGNQTQQSGGGGGLFGASSAPKPAGGSLFGNAGATNTAVTATQGAGLFGSSAKPAGGGLFGNTASTAPTTTGGGLFGAGNATKPAAGGLFGQAATGAAGGGSLFGSNTSKPSGGGLFGQGASTSTGGTGLFGGSASTQAPSSVGLFGGTAAQTGVVQNHMRQPQAMASMVEQRLRTIENRLSNDFKVELYADKDILRGAVDEHYSYIDGTDNPNPGRLAGVDIDNCLDMKARLESQNNQIDDITEKALGLKKQLQGECQQMQEKCRSDLQNYTDKLLELSCKVIQMIKKIEIVRANGRGLTGEEEIFRSKLMSLEKELEKPNNCKARLSELHSRFKMTHGVQAGQDKALVDSGIFAAENVQKLKQVLASTNVGINKLFEVLNDDAADMTLIHKELALNGR